MLVVSSQNSCLQQARLGEARQATLWACWRGNSRCVRYSHVYMPFGDMLKPMGCLKRRAGRACEQKLWAGPPAGSRQWREEREAIS